MTVCKNCGGNIVQHTFADGPEWFHQPVGASGIDGIEKFCRLNAARAEPEDELPGGIMGNSHEMDWAERRIAARPQEILAGLDRQAEHNYQMLLQENERLRKELEQAKTLYNDLAHKHEVILEDADISKPENPEAVNYHLTDSEFKRYCDNARAYGWEAGKRDHSNLTGTGRLQAMYTSSRGNPFVDPDWDAHLKTEDGQGFIVTAKDNQL
jgi:hypothetical protein